MFETTALSKLLEEERQAILAGAFDDITRLSGPKEVLLAGLAKTAAPVAELRRIAAEVSRNQTLLASAIEGVRSVIYRMADLRRAKDGFESYGPQGLKTTVGGHRPAFERKA